MLEGIDSESGDNGNPLSVVLTMDQLRELKIGLHVVTNDRREQGCQHMRRKRQGGDGRLRL